MRKIWKCKEINCHIRETAHCDVWFLSCAQGKASPGKFSPQGHSAELDTRRGARQTGEQERGSAHSHVHMWKCAWYWNSIKCGWWENCLTTYSILGKKLSHPSKSAIIYWSNNSSNILQIDLRTLAGGPSWGPFPKELAAWPATSSIKQTDLLFPWRETHGGHFLANPIFRTVTGHQWGRINFTPFCSFCI